MFLTNLYSIENSIKKSIDNDHCISNHTYSNNINHTSFITNIDSIILEVSIILPIMDSLSQFIMKNDILKQYTMWNFYILLRYMITNNKEILHFLTSNFIMIFIIFHSFFILQPELIHKMPRKMNMSYTVFHIQNFIFHIFPPLYCLTQDFKIMQHTHMYCNTFLFLWILIIENGKIQLKGIYSINKKHREKLLLFCIILNFLIPKIILYLRGL
jgi:hypothetical protein